MRLLLVLFALLSPAAACAASTKAPASPSAEAISTSGTIQEIREGGIVVIAHDEIPGRMRAMTMPFEAETAALAGLVVGDRVRFVFEDREDGRRPIRSIEKIQKIESAE
jgi:Cu/Ag efflux protein CusF